MLETAERPKLERAVEVERPHVWQRWMTISCHFILLLVLVYLCMTPIVVPDLFWQLRTGNDILRHHQIPHHDAYSWTRHGAPWVAQEWLTFVIFSIVYKTAHGFGGLWLFEVVMITAVFVTMVTYLLKNSEAHPTIPFLFVLAAAVATMGFFQPRPQLFTYLFLTVIVGVLLDIQRGKDYKYLLSSMPIFFILWANLHSGVLIGVAVIMLFAVGNLLEVIRSRNVDDRRHFGDKAILLFKLTALCLAATFVNPYGWKEHQDFIATIRNATALDFVGEWLSPSIRNPWDNIFFTYAFILIFCYALTRRRRNIPEILVIVMFGYEALMFNRNGPLFAIAVGLICFPHVYDMLLRVWEVLSYRLGEARIARLNTAFQTDVLPMVFPVLFVLAICIGMRGTGTKMNPFSNHGIAEHTYQIADEPESACRFMQTEGFPTTIHMFNMYEYGGYLIWRLPQYQVSIDGRADLYFGKEFNNYVHGGYIYDVLHDHDGKRVDVVMDRAFSPLSDTLSNRPDWTLVYCDLPQKNKAQNVIYVRKIPELEGLIQRCRHDLPNVMQRLAKV